MAKRSFPFGPRGMGALGKPVPARGPVNNERSKVQLAGADGRHRLARTLSPAVQHGFRQVVGPGARASAKMLATIEPLGGRRTALQRAQEVEDVLLL